MNKAIIKGQTVHVAGKWNELTRNQLLRVMQVILRPLATDEDVETRLIAILLQLWRRPQLAGIMLRMPLLDVAELRLLTRAFLNQPVQLTKQLLPNITVGRSQREFFGPGDELGHVTFQEWIEAENAYFRHRQGEAGQLLRLVAILYRPRSKRRQASGDVREEFSHQALDARVAALEHLPYHVSQAILFYYDSSRAALIKRSPDLFPGKEYEDDPDPVPTNPTRNYLELLDELAGTPDRYEVIGQQPVPNVFFNLNKKVKQSNEMAARLEEMKNGESRN